MEEEEEEEENKNRITFAHHWKLRGKRRGTPYDEETACSF